MCRHCASCVCVPPQTLSQQDIELHLLDGQALPVGQLKNGSRIKTRVGTLSIFGVADLLNSSALVRVLTAAEHQGATLSILRNISLVVRITDTGAETD